MRTLLTYVSGGQPVDDYLELLREELALGEDLRAPDWRKHDLAPDLQSQVTLQFGTRDDQGGFTPAGVVVGTARSRTDRVISAAASLNYQLSQTVTTRALYQISNSSGGGAGDVTQNLVLVGLRKTF